MAVENLKIEYRPISDIREYSRNARTHPAKQVEQLAASIKEFGFTNPILVSESGEVIAGHGRLEAAKLLGLCEVPTISLCGLSEAQRKALVLADNRIAESSGWNKELLSVELADLQGAGFAMGTIGFTDRELGEMLQPNAGGGLTDPDDAPALPDSTASKLGDVWVLGHHRVTCGDSCDAISYERSLGGGAG